MGQLEQQLHAATRNLAIALQTPQKHMLNPLPHPGLPQPAGWSSSEPLTASYMRGANDNRLARLEFRLAMAAVFTSPMNFLRHDAVYFTLSDSITLLCLLTMIVRRSLPLRPMGPFTALWFSGTAVFAGALLISSLSFGDATRGLIVSMQYLYSLVLLPLIITNRPASETVLLCKIFVLSIFIMCVFGIYLVEVDGTRYTRFVSGAGRMMSFVERENECASLIALTIPIVNWLRSQRHIRLTTAVITSSVMIYGILLTGSNTGLAAIVLVYCLQIFINFSIWHAVFGTAALGTAYYAVVAWGQIFLPAVFQKRVLPALQSGDLGLAGTLNDRMLLLYESLDQANNTFWLGVGADQYRVHSYYDHVVHNTYTLIWTEGGLPALAGFAVVILAGLCTAVVRFQEKSRRADALCAITCVLVFAAAINAVPHVYARFWFVPIYLGLAVVLGASTVGKKERRSHALSANGRRRQI